MSTLWIMKLEIYSLKIIKFFSGIFVIGEQVLILHLTVDSKLLLTNCDKLLGCKLSQTRTTDTQWRHKSKISEKLGRCGRQNMLPPYLKIWDWDWIFGRAVKTISSLGVRSPCLGMYHKVVSSRLLFNFWAILVLLTKTHY